MCADIKSPAGAIRNQYSMDKINNIPNEAWHEWWYSNWISAQPCFSISEFILQILVTKKAQIWWERWNTVDWQSSWKRKIELGLKIGSWVTQRPEKRKIQISTYYNPLSLEATKICENMLCLWNSTAVRFNKTFPTTCLGKSSHSSPLFWRKMATFKLN